MLIIYRVRSPRETSQRAWLLTDEKFLTCHLIIRILGVYLVYPEVRSIEHPSFIEGHFVYIANRTIFT